MEFPPRSPDINSTRFISCQDVLKGRVYAMKPTALKQLKDCTVEVATTISAKQRANVRTSIVQCCRLCLGTNGSH